ILELLAASEIVNNIINKIEQLQNQIPNRHFGLLSKVYQLAIKPPPNRPPFVFLNQRTSVESETHVHTVELRKFRHDCLDQCRQRYHFIDARWNVANTKLQRRKLRMRSNVPPDLLG